MTTTTVQSATPATPGASGANRYPCFDGLRAIAALAVVAYHSGGLTYGFHTFTSPTWLLSWMSRLGFFGVGVFFVISGFLLYRPFAIAALTDQPPPRLGPFWKRRFFRILPAYWVALAISVYLLGQDPFGSLQEAVFQFGLLQNYRDTWLRNGLGVSWTLVIELSFYLLLPFIAMAIRSLAGSAASVSSRMRVQLVGLAIMAALGIAFRTTWLFAYEPGRASPGAWFPLRAFTYWLPGYLDWFALGMAMAVASAWFGLGRRLPHWLTLLGRLPWLSWLLAVGCYWLVTQLGLGIFVNQLTFGPEQALMRWTFTGLAAAFFVLPAVFGPQDQGFLRAFLRHPIMVFLGLISYGIYLWHFPMWNLVLEWQNDGSFSSEPLVQVAFVLGSTIILAALSYMLVERPIIFWSSGRSAPKLNDLKVTTLHPVDAGADAPSVDDAPKSGVTSGHVIVALAIVSIAVFGLVVGSLNLRASASRNPDADRFAWRGARSTVWDSFQRPPQAGLGTATSGQTWEVLGGSWSIANNDATAGPAPTLSFAVVRVDPGTPINARATPLGETDHAGIAFRCQDAQNCWWIEAVRGYATWNINKIVNGRVTLVDNVGPAGTDPGSIVAVHTNGSRITVAVNGIIRREITDPDLRDATGVGLVRGAKGTNPVRFKRFEATGASSP